jgi:hypothetical protein
LKGLAVSCFGLSSVVDFYAPEVGLYFEMKLAFLLLLVGHVLYVRAFSQLGTQGVSAFSKETVGLIIVDHGSRRESANQLLFQVSHISLFIFTLS